MLTSLRDGCVPNAFSKRKCYTVDELAQFFVTGLIDFANKLNEFYCRICRKIVSVLTHGMYESLQHLQRHRHFARNQRLRFQTPGWRVVDYEDNPLPEDELERQRPKNLIVFFRRAQLLDWRRSDCGSFRKARSSTIEVGKGVMPHRCAPVGWELRARPETLEAICVHSQPAYCNCFLVSRRRSA